MSETIMHGDMEADPFPSISFFIEKDYVFKSISNLLTLSNGIHDEEAVKIIVADVTQILEKYLEKPSLLDMDLERLVTESTAVLQSLIPMFLDGYDFNALKIMNEVAKILYSLCKLRGHKKVLKFFPHETKDMDYVLKFLERSYRYSENVRIDPLSDSNMPCNDPPWQVIYIFFLWMSNLCLIPFDFALFDNHHDPRTVVDQIYYLCLSAFKESSLIQDSAAICLARLVSRPDVLLKDDYLEILFAIVIQNCAKDGREKLENPYKMLFIDATPQQIGFIRRATIYCLAYIFKFSDRNTLAKIMKTKYLSTMMQIVANVAADIHSHGKIATTFELRPALKILTRSVLILLPKSINVLHVSHSHNALAQIEEKNALAIFSHEDHPEYIEEAIENMLFALDASDSFVRWSASKAIGKIFERLPSNDARNALIESLLMMNDSHGAMLCFAELARRGLLNIQANFEHEETKAILSTAFNNLVHEKQKGYAMLGSNVRDAACFFFWAFSRTYPSELLAYLERSVTNNLLLTALFDNEIGCRRSAAAALQEFLGRIGHHYVGGDDPVVAMNSRMSLISEVNFLSVGNKKATFGELVALVALNSPERRLFFIEYLLDRRVPHSDPKLRDLGVQAILSLLKDNFDFIVQNNFARLFQIVDAIMSPEQNNDYRHGMLMLLSGLIELVGQKDNHLLSSLTIEQKKLLRNIVMTLEKARCYRGRNGDKVREGILRLVSALMSISASLEFTDKTFARLFETIADGLYSPLPAVGSHAAEALGRLYAAAGEGNALLEAEEFLNMYVKKFIIDARMSLNVAHRKGAILAVAKIPHRMFSFMISASYAEGEPKPIVLAEAVVNCFIICSLRTNLAYSNLPMDLISKIPLEKNLKMRANLNRCQQPYYTVVGPEENNDPELRSLAVQAGFKLLPFLTERSLLDFVFCVILCLDDYDLDTRGDVGSWVRKAALEGIPSLFDSLTTSSCIPHPIIVHMIGQMIKQLFGKLGNLRETAFFSLQQVVEAHFQYLINLLNIDTEVQQQELISAVCNITSNSSDWRSEANLPKFARLHYIPSLRPYVLEGLCSCVADLTPTISEQGQIALRSVLENQTNSEYGAQLYLTLLKNHVHCDRAFTPILKTFALLISTREIGVKELMNEGLEKEILNVCNSRIACNDIHILRSIGSISSICLPNAIEKQNWWRLLVNLLGHKYPIIRKSAADATYLAMLETDVDEGYQAFGFSNVDQFQQTLTLLVSKDWLALHLSDAKDAATTLANFLGISKKAGNKQSINVSFNNDNKENIGDSYESLVHSAELGL